MQINLANTSPGTGRNSHDFITKSRFPTSRQAHQYHYNWLGFLLFFPFTIEREKERDASWFVLQYIIGLHFMKNKRKRTNFTSIAPVDCAFSRSISIDSIISWPRDAIKTPLSPPQFKCPTWCWTHQHAFHKSVVVNQSRFIISHQKNKK